MLSTRTFSPVTRFLLFLGVVAVGVLTAGSDWSFNHGVMFAGAGLLMTIFSPVEALPRSWWLLSLGFVLSLGMAFLPDGLFSILSWRSDLEKAGLGTSNGVAVQGWLALETAVVFAAAMLVGLWLLGQRVSAEGLRVVGLTFTLGVAAYAVLSFIFREQLAGTRSPEHFGFFPNRNHTATLLAMGSITGLGSLVQGIRERRGWTIVISLVANAICLWAVIDWSVSRAGVVLVGGGVVTWLVALGPSYLAGNARKALLIFGVAAVGGFLLVDSQVKERLVHAVERVGGGDGGEGEAPHPEHGKGLDFRVPSWQDTLGMIRDRPWTGFGAGHFSFVFPQYRDRTAVANETRHVHPESDWLWLVAEAGIPSGVLVAGLVLAPVVSAWRGLPSGRSRSIRAGCMVAALVLVFHSLFDVPGHRVPLAWTAALLLGLSQRPAATECRGLSRFFFRAGGVAVLAFGLWLLVAQKLGLPEPATLRGDRAVVAAEELYRSDLVARSESRLPPAYPGEDPLIRALAAVEEALRVVPLDHRLHHLDGILAMEFAGRTEQVDRAFEIEGLLEPVQATLPLRQATAWAPIDPSRGLELVNDVRVRAARLDAKAVAPPRGADSWASYADSRIIELIKKFPALRTEE